MNRSKLATGHGNFGRWGWLLVIAGAVLSACSEPVAEPFCVTARRHALEMVRGGTAGPGSHAQKQGTAARSITMDVHPGPQRPAVPSKEPDPSAPVPKITRARPHNVRQKADGAEPNAGTSHQEAEPQASRSHPISGNGFANGVACTFSSDCASHDCTFRVCQGHSGDKQLGNGVACTFSSDCASHDCTFHVCQGRSGDKQLGNGVACMFSSDCASHDCTFHVCQGR
jgi:hypothetical protein